MQEQEYVSVRGGKRLRSVSQILARQRRRQRRRRQVFPPDFAHGEVVLGSVYEVLGKGWAERAIFVVDDGEVVTVAYFDDYFMVVEQWDEQSDEAWKSWWDARCEGRDRVVSLQSKGPGRSLGSSSVSMMLDRQRLHLLEEVELGVVREWECMGEGRMARLRRSEIDALTLVALTSRLCSRT